MAALLAIPSSNNADSQCGFSNLRKIHRDQILSFGQSTVVDLMSLKFNNNTATMKYSVSRNY